MHEPELPNHLLAAIDQRVRHRVRRNMVLIGLTLLAGLSLLAVPGWPGGAVIAWALWIAYAVWYLYQATVERDIRREVERERAHQLQLAREGRRVKREERYAHLAGLADDREAFLADDGELWFEDEDKPKRRLDT